MGFYCVFGRQLPSDKSHRANLKSQKSVAVDVFGLWCLLYFSEIETSIYPGKLPCYLRRVTNSPYPPCLKKRMVKSLSDCHFDTSTARSSVSSVRGLGSLLPLFCCLLISNSTGGRQQKSTELSCDDASAGWAAVTNNSSIGQQPVSPG